MSKNLKQNSHNKAPAAKAGSQKVAYFVPVLLALLLFGFIWIDTGTEIEDPWYSAVMLVDSAQRTEDPVAKQKLLEQGGGQLRTLVAKHPYHARLNHLFGIYYAVSGKYDSAVAMQIKAVELGKGGLVNQIEFPARREIVRVVTIQSRRNLEKEEFKEAFEVLAPGFKYAGNSAELYNQAGVVMYRQKLIDSAIFYYEKALKIDPKHQKAVNNIALAYFIIGDSFLKQQQYDKALENLALAARYTPGKAEVFNHLGVVYLKQKNLPEAEKAFAKATAIKPGYAQAKQNLAIVKQMMQQH